MEYLRSNGCSIKLILRLHVVICLFVERSVMSDLDSNRRSCLHAAACGGYVCTSVMCDHCMQITFSDFTTPLSLRVVRQLDII